MALSVNKRLTAVTVGSRMAGVQSIGARGARRGVNSAMEIRSKGKQIERIVLAHGAADLRIMRLRVAKGAEDALQQLCQTGLFALFGLGLEAVESKERDADRPGRKRQIKELRSVGVDPGALPDFLGEALAGCHRRG